MKDETETTALQQKQGRGVQRLAAWLAIAAIIVLLDQATKWLIVDNVPLYAKIQITTFLNLTHQQNPGAAFSFLADAGGWQRWFFTGLATVVSLFILGWLWQLRRENQSVLPLGLALVLGGALGNLIDRLVQGYVTDFIQVLFGSWAFPSFNVADAAISVGAAFLIIDALFLSGRDEKKSIDEAGSDARGEAPGADS